MKMTPPIIPFVKGFEMISICCSCTHYNRFDSVHGWCGIHSAEDAAIHVAKRKYVQNDDCCDWHAVPYAVIKSMEKSYSRNDIDDFIAQAMDGRSAESCGNFHGAFARSVKGKK